MANERSTEKNTLNYLDEAITYIKIVKRITQETGFIKPMLYTLNETPLVLMVMNVVFTSQ